MFTPEQYAKAKAAKSAEELLAYAKEVGYELTEEDAKKYFEQWQKEGELADEELENVSGGSFPIGCCTYSSDPPHLLIVTSGNSCPELELSDAFSGTYGNCGMCKYSFGSSPMYCKIRNSEHDPYNDLVGGGLFL